VPAAAPLSPIEVQQALAAFVGDPDEHVAGLLEQAARRVGHDTSLGTLLGDAIARAVYGDDL